MCDTGFNLSRSLGGSGKDWNDLGPLSDMLGKQNEIMAPIAGATLAALGIPALAGAVQGGVGNLGAGIQQLLGAGSDTLGSVVRDPIGTWQNINSIPIDYTFQDPGGGTQSWTNKPFRDYSALQARTTARNQLKSQVPQADQGAMAALLALGGDPLESYKTMTIDKTKATVDAKKAEDEAMFAIYDQAGKILNDKIIKNELVVTPENIDTIYNGIVQDLITKQPPTIRGNVGKVLAPAKMPGWQKAIR